jgi:hypothetical protein
MRALGVNSEDEKGLLLARQAVQPEVRRDIRSRLVACGLNYSYWVAFARIWSAVWSRRQDGLT